MKHLPTHLNLLPSKAEIPELRKDGWLYENQEGSRRQFVHPVKPGKVTVHGHESDEIKPKTLTAIKPRAGF